MGEVIVLAIFGVFVWIAFKWGKEEAAPATPNPVASTGSTLDQLSDSIWGPNYVPPSTGSVPERISQTIWGNDENWIDKFFAGLNSLFGGSSGGGNGSSGNSQPPSTGSDLVTPFFPYGTPPAGLDEPANPNDYVQGYPA